MQRGFSLVELIVVVFIILILTAVVLGNYQSGGQALALQRSAARLAQDIRLIQAMAMGSREYTGCDPAGYGIYLHAEAMSNPPHKPGCGAYFLFADCDYSEPGGEYNSGGGGDPILEIEATEFERGVNFIRAYYSDGSNNPHATIIFYPPEPRVTIKCDSGFCDSVKLKFDIKGQEKCVHINSKGLVYVLDTCS